MLKFCPYCGVKIVSQEARFCMSCGKSIAAFAESQFTPVAKTPAPKQTAVAQVSLPTVKAVRQVGNSSDAELQKALQDCRETAEEGYKLASEKFNEIVKTLAEERKHIEQSKSEQKNLNRVQSDTAFVEKQEKEIAEITTDIKIIRENIATLRQRQKDFSIIVYGRTMAGKSTLMEILTHGNGQSIGKGGQRTTLDIREYYWQGLKITDVPGICAFGGAADEKIAMDAAKAADLILFLLTNDAPQADEAKALAELKSLGKPILGLINVKMAFNIERKNLALKKLQKTLADTSTINTIIEQFKAFDKRHDQDWSDIKFVPTHLLSAYQAHPSRNYDAEVYAASNFTQVEKFIIDKVKADGRFIRVKTFIDSVAVPMNRIIEQIYDHSGKTLLESQIWHDKAIELGKWRKEFFQRSETKLNRLYAELSERLNNEIYNFAEYHYEDDKVNEHWGQTIKNLRLEESYREFLKSLANECNRKRKELSDELTQQISYSFRGNTQTNIELESTTTWGKYAAFVLPNLLMLVPGIGWGARIAIGVGSALFSFLFDDKEAKIREAKEKLRKDLTGPSFEMLKNMHNKVIEVFRREILNKGIDDFRNLLIDYYHMLARLGDSQNSMANNLLEKFKSLNAVLLDNAIRYKDVGKIDKLGKDDNIIFLRLPGKQFIILVRNADKIRLNNTAISSLLGEKFFVVVGREIKMFLGCDFTTKHYYTMDALFPIGQPSKTNLRLAQQLAYIPIIAEKF